MYIRKAIINTLNRIITGLQGHGQSPQRLVKRPMKRDKTFGLGSGAGLSDLGLSGVSFSGVGLSVEGLSVVGLSVVGLSVLGLLVVAEEGVSVSVERGCDGGSPPRPGDEALLVFRGGTGSNPNE